MYLSAIGKPETPETVNEKVKSVNGFVDGGKLVWSAPETIWGIKCIYQSPYYSGPLTSQGKTKMKTLLDEKRPLICHVDFDPNDPDDDMHWILVTDYEGNNFYCNDPWTGQHVNIDVYGGSVERAVIEFRAYDPIVTTDSVTNVMVDSTTFERLVDNSTTRDKIRDTLNCADNNTVILAEVNRLKGFEQAVIDKDKIITEAQKKITELENKIKQLTDDHTQFALASTKTIQDQGQDIIELQGSIQELKKDCKPQPVYTGIKKWIYDIFLK